jgi:hypothetical protein
VGVEKKAGSGSRWRFKEERGGLAFSQSGGSAAFQPPHSGTVRWVMGAWTKRK